MRLLAAQIPNSTQRPSFTETLPSAHFAESVQVAKKLPLLPLQMYRFATADRKNLYN